MNRVTTTTMRSAAIPLTETQALAVEKVLALRQYSREHHMVTSRAQNIVLSELNDRDLAVVVLELKRRSEGSNNESNRDGLTNPI